MEKFIVGMRANSGEMTPSYEKVLCEVEDLEGAMAAIVADAESSRFFEKFTDPSRPGGRLHEYYICEGKLNSGREAYDEIMSKRRISFYRRDIQLKGFPPVSEWKWRDPLF